MSRKVPASEYMGYDKYIEDEEDMVVGIPIKHESKPYLMIPLPEGTTNGDMIKAMFPTLSFNVILSKMYASCGQILLDWWNAPYKGESEGKE